MVAFPPRLWNVVVVELDGSETQDQFEQERAEMPPSVRQQITTKGGRDVVIDELSSRDPKSGTVGEIRARPLLSRRRS